MKSLNKLKSGSIFYYVYGDSPSHIVEITVGPNFDGIWILGKCLSGDSKGQTWYYTERQLTFVANSLDEVSEFERILHGI